MSKSYDWGIVSHWGYNINPQYYIDYSNRWNENNRERYKQNQQKWYQRNRARIALKGLFKRLETRQTPVSDTLIKKIGLYNKMLYDKKDGKINAFRDKSDKEKIEWVDHYNLKCRERTRRYYIAKQKKLNKTVKDYNPRPRKQKTDEQKIEFFNKFHIKQRKIHQKWYYDVYKPKIEKFKKQFTPTEELINFRKQRERKRLYHKEYYHRKIKDQKEEENKNNKLKREYIHKTLTFD